MPAKPASSPIFLIAFVLSMALALLVAFLVVAPKLRNGDTAIAEAPPVETPIENPIPSPTPTPASDLVEAVETPVPTPAPKVEATPATAAVVTVQGSIQGASGELVEAGSVYIVPSNGASIEEAVRAADVAKTLVVAAADELGFFEAEIKPDTEYYVGLMLAGEPQIYAQRIEKNAAGSDVELSMTMPKGVALRGTIVDQNGEGVAGIPLKLETRYASLLKPMSEPRVTLLESGERGAFLLNIVEPLSISISVDRENLPAPFIDEGKPVVVGKSEIPASKSIRADLEIVRGAKIDGTVVDAESGEPVEGVALVMRPIGSEAGLDTVSAAGGAFDFPTVRPGTYYVEATADGYMKSQLFAYDPMADSAPRIEMSKLPGINVRAEISGTVSEATGYIALIGKGRGESVRADADFADGIGEATFAQVRPWQYLLVAFAESGDRRWYGEQEISVSGNASEAVAIRLSELAEVGGRIAPKDGIDLANLQIVVNPADKSAVAWQHPEWRHPPIASFSSGARFTIDDVPFGGDSLAVVSDRETGKLHGSAVVKPGAAGELEIQLNGVGTIAGIVRNPRNETCPGIVVLTTGLTLVDGMPGKVETRETPIGIDGFEFKYVPAGACRISLKDQPEVSRLVTCVADDITRVKMECREFVEVSFDFRGEPEQPFRRGEQFLIMPKLGTNVAKRVVEIEFGNSDARLEPGQYTITRTETMDSKSFEVLPRLGGALAIDFTR